MVEVVVLEGQRVDQLERLPRAVDLRDRDGPVERDDRGRREDEELVVEREDLFPVGVGCSGRVAVDRVDRRLELVGTWLVSPQASFDERLSFLIRS